MKYFSLVMVTLVLFICGFVFHQYIVPHANARHPAQYDLTRTHEENQYIDAALADLLKSNTQPILARIALIHNGVNLPNQSQTSLFRWDITNQRSALNFHEPAMIVDRPLSEWRDYIGDMMDNICSYIVVDAMNDNDARARLQNLGISSFLVCPLVNKNNELLGGLFVSWNGSGLSNDQIKSIIHDTTVTAHSIVTKIDNEF